MRKPKKRKMKNAVLNEALSINEAAVVAPPVEESLVASVAAAKVVAKKTNRRSCFSKYSVV